MSSLLNPVFGAESVLLVSSEECDRGRGQLGPAGRGEMALDRERLVRGPCFSGHQNAFQTVLVYYSTIYRQQKLLFYEFF